MAEMIPRTLDPAVEKDPKKSAEVTIYREIQKDNGLQDWLCLHSLNLETPKASSCGETDFVLLGRQGIFCLEVKGGGIRCEDGRWISVDRSGDEHEIKNPLVQAKDASYIVKKTIEGHYRDLREKLLFGYGVAFPSCSFGKESIELPREIVYDRTDSSSPISSYLNRVSGYFNEKINREKIRIDKEVKDRIKNVLRPDFEIFEPLGFILNKIEEEIECLTTEQYRVFDALASNARIMVKGKAGTGKTLMARHHCRNIARQGKRVLFLCYNVLLGESLRAEVAREKMDDMVHVDRVFNFLNTVIHEGKYKDEFEQNFNEWKLEKKNREIMTDLYPKYFAWTLKDWGSKFQKYDYLIIDEGQDMLRDSLMDGISGCLKGGLEKGDWCIFYDPENQVEVFPYYDEEFCKLLIEECHPAQYELTVNCRNTKQIARETAAITGFDMAETKVSRGEEVKYFYYKDSNDLKAKVSVYLKEMIKDGIKYEDINILYPGGKREVEEALHDLSGINTQPLTEKNLNTHVAKTILTCSIQKYKGLENKVIIIAGLEHVGDISVWQKAVYYVGMSRAKALLCIFANARIKDAVEKMRRSGK